MTLLLCVLFLFSSVSSSYIFPSNFEVLLSSTRFADGISKFLQYSKTDISNKCYQKLERYSNSLLNRDQWALEMLDATSKIPSGLLSMNDGDLGDFDQCIGINNEITLGKYCIAKYLIPGSQSRQSFTLLDNVLAPSLLTTNITTSRIFIGICAPSDCSALEIQALLSHFDISVLLLENYCQDRLSVPAWSTADKGMMTFLALAFCAVVVSTAYDFFSSRKLKKTNILVSAFSLLQNGKMLFQQNTDSSQISCLHGLRTFALMWVICSHMIHIFTYYVPLTRRVDVDKWQSTMYIYPLIDILVVVDLFLFMGGFLVSYNYLKPESNKRKLNIVKHYVHRYVRITVPLLLMIAVHLSLLKHFGNGPYWFLVHNVLIDDCKTSWWSSLLHIQNYLYKLDVCVPQSWYLAVDFQLFLFTPVILNGLDRMPKKSLCMLVFLTLCSIVSAMLTQWFFQFYGYTRLEYFFKTDFSFYLYSPTHVRAAPWLIGIILGYVIRNTDLNLKTINNNKNLQIAIVALLWIIAVVLLMTGVTYGYHVFETEFDRVRSTLVFSLSGPLVTLSFCWIVYGCAKGYGGPINEFLSLPFFQFTSKVSYSVYLTHYQIIAVLALSTRNHLDFTDMFYRYLVILILSVVMGTILVLTVEYPVVRIEKYLWGKKKKGD